MRVVLADLAHCDGCYEAALFSFTQTTLALLVVGLRLDSRRAAVELEGDEVGSARPRPRRTTQLAESEPVASPASRAIRDARLLNAVLTFRQPGIKLKRGNTQ